MRRIIGQGVLAVITLSLKAQTPITITNAEMPVKNDTLRYTDVTPASVKNYLATGPNFTWDFTNVQPAGEGVRKFESPSATPYKFFFFGANTFGEKVSSSLGAGPLTITDFYDFYNKQTSPVNAYVTEGVGMTFSSIPLPAYYSDKDELYLFPLNFGDRDSTTFRFATITSTALPLSYSKTGYRITQVNGWGTINTPFGTEQCLRLVTTEYAQDSMKISLLPFPIGFPNFVRSYQWLTLKSKIPFFEVSGAYTAGNFTPNSARFRGSVPGKEVGLSENKEIAVNFHPNPVHEKLVVNGIDAGTAYKVYSVSGAVLMRGETQGETLDVSGLSNGIYFLRIHAKSGEINYRFVKE